MKVDIKDLPKSQKEINVEISVEELQKYYGQASERISKEIKVKGFRTGKIPTDVVKKTVGEAAIMEEAAQIAVRKTFLEILFDKKIDAIGNPDIQITQIAAGNPLKYKAVVYIMPEVKLGEYKGLKSDKKEVKIDKKEIQEVLKQLQKSRTKFVAGKDPVEKGNRVEVDFSAFQNGKMIENGEGKKYPLVVGDGAFIPDFEKELIGMTENEEKKFTVKMPANYHKKELAGQELECQVKVNSIQKSEVPVIDDKFAQELGQKVNTLAELEKDIEKQLLDKKKQEEDERLKMDLIKQVVSKSKMDIPQVLIDSELTKMLEEYKLNIQGAGMIFEDYLKQIGKAEEDIKKDWAKDAEMRVQVNLVLREIAKKEDVKIAKEEIEKEVDMLEQVYPEVKKNRQNAANFVENRKKNEKIFELLVKESK